MPVPVPRFSKPQAHPVIKQPHSAHAQAANFHNLTRTLPVAPTGPPPSFGTREEWINSLPTWRQTKPRRIWEDDMSHLAEQDFCQGLTSAENASVIKGACAEACIPPRDSLYRPPLAPGFPGSGGDADDEMSEYSPAGRSSARNSLQWSDNGRFENGSADVDQVHADAMCTSPAGVGASSAVSTYDHHSYERGAFTPIFEDQSPGGASGPDDSSPLGPVTPFADFVDRAVAAAEPCASYGSGCTNATIREYDYRKDIECYQPPVTYPSIADQPKEQAPVPEVVTPSANTGYKKLAEPLSDWVANYVWKVCTTGFSLPPQFVVSSNSGQYASAAPSYLAPAVHSLLLSTLLQPSAVFLAVWYIVRLPVFFGGAGLGTEHVKELRFRAALLGDAHASFERESMEASAPFRLIVLGCMLANKWLDDHTFSNKTWHTISNVPIYVLNKLESLTLDIFSYDLSIPSADWSQWLAHVMSYHLALSSPAYPQPISRPSSNPHSIIRKAIDEIIQAPSTCSSNSALPQPVFLGLEERKKERFEKEQAMAGDVLEINLDEDGPLREEYLPKRRASTASALNAFRHQARDAVQGNVESVPQWHRHADVAKALPPPAKWSPAGDEPILRERNRVSGHYVAVQAPHVTSYGVAYQQPQDATYAHQWNAAGSYLPIKQQTGYLFNVPTVHVSQPAYNPYTFATSIPMSHSRSQSLSYDQDNQQPHNHMRSFSQTQFEYRCSDIRMTVNELAPTNERDPRWAGQYPYGSAFGTGLGVQSAWLRT